MSKLLGLVVNLRSNIVPKPENVIRFERFVIACHNIKVLLCTDSCRICFISKSRTQVISKRMQNNIYCSAILGWGYGLRMTNLHFLSGSFCFRFVPTYSYYAYYSAAERSRMSVRPLVIGLMILADTASIRAGTLASKDRCRAGMISSGFSTTSP